MIDDKPKSNPKFLINGKVATKIITPQSNAIAEAMVGEIKALFDQHQFSNEIVGAFILNCLHAYSKDIQLIPDAELLSLPCPASHWKTLAKLVQERIRRYVS